MKRVITSFAMTAGVAVVSAVGLVGCNKMKQNDPRDAGKARAEAKRQRAACASPAAYDRLKGLVFDQAIVQRKGDRANLDVLADYSQTRMEEPVVMGWDPALDITRCRGRFILEIPPGTERALAGERRLQSEIAYTAQVAADGSGLVYHVDGAEPIVAKLATFNLGGLAYRPPPAIDDLGAEPRVTESTAVTQAAVPSILPGVPSRSLPGAEQRREPLAPQQTYEPARAPETSLPASRTALRVPAESETGEGTVRAFYHALGQGDGAAASAQVIPEKRSSRAFSPEAITRFYGALPEPVQLTGIAPLAAGAYRVSYRYSTGRSHCNGSAVVSVTNRGGRELVRSIRAMNGC